MEKLTLTRDQIQEIFERWYADVAREGTMIDAKPEHSTACFIEYAVELLVMG